MIRIRALENKEKKRIKPFISKIFPNANFTIKNSDEIFVYEIDSSPVAFAHLREYLRGTVLLGFGVLEDFRGQGIGKQLLSFVVNLAEKSHKTIYLKVRKNNHAAVSLYKSFGFRIIKRKGDRLIMKRACFS
ncbi:MAG: GNAT family N-acetyltransferase [Candidatus Anstonellales archaeon]